MVAIFLTKSEAQAFADKCHAWLQATCPDYSASCWQVPTSDKDGTKFFVQVPQEYYLQSYAKAFEVKASTDAEIKKASSVIEKPDASFTADVKPVEEKLIEP